MQSLQMLGVVTALPGSRAFSAFIPCRIFFLHPFYILFFMCFYPFPVTMQVKSVNSFAFLALLVLQSFIIFLFLNLDVRAVRA